MFEVLIAIIFCLVAAWLIFTSLTKAGKGLMFGGSIIKTYDGASDKRKIFTNKVKVHAVNAGNVRFVGLEVTIYSFASYQMIPVTFSAREAKQLAQMIIEAAEYKEY